MLGYIVLSTRQYWLASYWGALDGHYDDAFLDAVLSHVHSVNV